MCSHHLFQLSPQFIPCTVVFVIAVFVMFFPTQYIFLNFLLLDCRNMAVFLFALVLFLSDVQPVASALGSHGRVTIDTDTSACVSLDSLDHDSSVPGVCQPHQAYLCLCYTVCVCQPHQAYLCLCYTVCVCVSLTKPTCVCVTRCVCVSASPSLPVSVLHGVCVCQPHQAYLCLCYTVCVCASLTKPTCVCVTRCVCVSLTKPTCVCATRCVCVSLTKPTCVCATRGTNC